MAQVNESQSDKRYERGSRILSSRGLESETQKKEKINGSQGTITVGQRTEIDGRYLTGEGLVIEVLPRKGIKSLSILVNKLYRWIYNFFLKYRS